MSRNTMSNYLAAAESDAKETVGNYIDAIVDQLIDNGEASDDLNNDYDNGDAWHHENHVDKWYNLREACEIICELDEFEETDSGLWQGQAMKEALATCAAFTYGNAVYHEWTELIREINEEAESIISDFDDKERDLTDEIEQLDEDAGTADADEEPDIAEEYRREMEDKQTELDALPEKKKDALRDMVAERAA